METRITVNRTKLMEALQIVGAAAAGQSTIPLYMHVLFAFSPETGIALRATDANTYIEGSVASASGEGACEIAVLPKRLAAILQNMNREEIEIAAKDATLTFTCGKQRASLPGMAGEDFIDLPKVDAIHRFVLAASDLREGIRRAAHASLAKKVDTETDKKWACLCVSADAGRLKLNASDGNRFGQIVCPVDEYEQTAANIPGNQGKKRQGQPLQHRKAEATMIPLAELAKIDRMIAAAGALPLTLEIGWRMVAVACGDYRASLPIWDQPEFATGAVRVISQRLEAGFKSNATVDREALLRTLKAAKAALPSEGMDFETHPAVAVMLWEGEDGRELWIATGDRGGSYYTDTLPAEIDLADHFEGLNGDYLAAALGAATSPKVRLRFSAVEADAKGRYNPGATFVEEVWENKPDEPAEQRPEWLALVMPLMHESATIFGRLVPEWEKLCGQPWSEGPPPAELSSEGEDAGEGEEYPYEEEEAEIAESIPDPREPVAV